MGKDVVGNEHTAYGGQIVSTPSTQLQAIYGTIGLGIRSVRRMMQFAASFPDIQIVAPLMRQFEWFCFIEALPLISRKLRNHWQKPTKDSAVRIRREENEG